MKSAFETWDSWICTENSGLQYQQIPFGADARYASEHGPHGVTKELSKKDMSSLREVLLWHFLSFFPEVDFH